MSNVLLKIGGVPVYQDADGSVHWVGEMTIDADGCPRSYGPEGTKPLDYLANAGYPYDENDPYGPGNWWGVVTASDGRIYSQKSGDKEKWPWPKYFLSTTAYLVSGYDKYDARHYVDSEKVCFGVVPGNVRTSIPPKFMGCKMIITDMNTDKELECVCADVGPSSHLGETSIAAAQYFGISGDPKSGGSSDRTRWHYRCYPGVASKNYPLQ